MKAWVYCSKGGSDVVRSKSNACMLHMQRRAFKTCMHPRWNLHFSILSQRTQGAFLHYRLVVLHAWLHAQAAVRIGILSCPTTRMRAILIMCVAPHMSICMPSCTWLCVIQPMVLFVTAFLILYTSVPTHALIQIVLVERRKQRWRRRFRSSKWRVCGEHLKIRWCAPQ